MSGYPASMLTPIKEAPLVDRGCVNMLVLLFRSQGAVQRVYGGLDIGRRSTTITLQPPLSPRLHRPVARAGSIHFSSISSPS